VLGEAGATCKLVSPVAIAVDLPADGEGPG